MGQPGPAHTPHQVGTLPAQKGEAGVDGGGERRRGQAEGQDRWHRGSAEWSEGRREEQKRWGPTSGVQAEAGAEGPRRGKTPGPDYGCWVGERGEYHSSRLLSLKFPRPVREGLPFLTRPLPSRSQGTHTLAPLPMCCPGTQESGCLILLHPSDLQSQEAGISVPGVPGSLCCPPPWTPDLCPPWGPRGTMWRCPQRLLLLLLLAGSALGVRRGRGRRELAPALHLRGIRDAGGRYCQEQDLCCRGRADDCSLPYLGSTCYCDLFCNRTISDCCPDFWDFCLGVPPPIPPIQGGHRTFRGGVGFRPQSPQGSGTRPMH